MSKVYLIENHNEAFFLWEKNKFMKETCIHIDAHSDFNTKDLSSITLNNYLFFAIKKGIVSKLYWIIPGSPADFAKNHRYLLGLVRILGKAGEIRKKIEIQSGRIAFEILKTHISICPLVSLPPIEEKVLLDIDLDYFVINDVGHSDNTDNIGKRKPWISQARFLSLIDKKIPSRKMTTIAYSVYGGYTPIKYKHLGDELAYKLGLKNSAVSERITAGKYFLKYDFYQQKNNQSLARKYFFLALAHNSKYSVLNNNYGFLYLKIGKFGLAEKEFRSTLEINSGDEFANLGMSLICKRKKDSEAAVAFLKKAPNLAKFMTSKQKKFLLNLI